MGRVHQAWILSYLDERSRISLYYLLSEWTEITDIIQSYCTPLS